MSKLEALTADLRKEAIKELKARNFIARAEEMKKDCQDLAILGQGFEGSVKTLSLAILQATAALNAQQEDAAVA